MRRLGERSADPTRASCTACVVSALRRTRTYTPGRRALRNSEECNASKSSIAARGRRAPRSWSRTPIPRSSIGWRTGSRSAVFWALAAIVFSQFFTRYVLNDSAAWTEEIARYLLIAIVFIGAADRRRKNNHIAGRLLLPPHAGRRRPRAVGAGGYRSHSCFIGTAGLFLVTIDRAHAVQHAHDHHRPADEHRLRRRACSGFAPCACARSQFRARATLAARLQRARSAESPDRSI